MNVNELREKLEEIYNTDGIYEVIEFVEGQYEAQIPSASKPVLPRNGTPQDYIDYAAELEAYEKIKYSNSALNQAIIERNNERKTILIDFIKSKSNIPEQYLDKAWNFAWRHAQSSGMYEEWYIFDELENIFL